MHIARPGHLGRSLMLVLSLAAAQECAAAAELQSLHSFTSQETSTRLRADAFARYPHAFSAPVVTADGAVYGTNYIRLVTESDPYATRGETRLWRWTEAGGYEVVAVLPVDGRARNDLTGVRYDSHQISGSWLTLGADGKVYGLTEFSEDVDSTGRFFRLNADDSVEVLYRFPTYRPEQYAGALLREDADPALRLGSRPQVKLTLGPDGNFYGATFESGIYYRSGGLIRLSPAGEASLMMGPRNNREGLSQYSQMTVADDGQLYGLNYHVQDEAPYGSDIYRLGTDAVYSVIGELTTADFSPQRARMDSLQQGADSWLYGTSYYGGDQLTQISEGGGVLYRLRTDGTGLERIHTFSKPYVFLNDEIVYQPSADGAIVNPGLVRDSKGNFYGTTIRGGTHTQGTVFRLSPDREFAVLHAFSALDAQGSNAEGAQPMAGLALSPDEKTLYGITSMGGANGLGTAFALTIDEPPPQASISWTFNPITVGAGLQMGGATILKWASAGATSCTASGGGNVPGDWSGEKAFSGEMLIVAAKAGNHTYSLTCTNAAGLSTTTDSVLVVRENAKESYGNGGGSPAGGLLAALAALAWLRRRGTRGLRLLAGLALMTAATAAPAAGLQVLHDFTADETSRAGSIAHSAPVITADGVLHGTTWRTLRRPEDPTTPRGETRLWRWSPEAGYRVARTLDVVARTPGDSWDFSMAGTWLTLGADGKVYGLAEFSDDANHNGRFFRLDADGSYTELRRLSAFSESHYVRGKLVEGADPSLRIGMRPKVKMTLGTDGKFYGAMADGGSYYRMGGLFRLDSAGNIELMHEIHSVSEGYQQYSAMAAGSDGTMYGLNWHFGDSTVDRTAMGSRLYRLGTSGYQVINELFRQDFYGERFPEMDSLIEGAGGYLYGTSFEAGDNTSQTTAGGGVVYRLRLDGTGLERVHTFSKPYVFINDQLQPAPNADGSQVNPGLVRDAEGNIYGTTFVGGAGFAGGIYRIAPDGGFSLLHSFAALDAQSRNVGGGVPRAGLAISADGRTLYGTTSTGGANGLGTVFALDIAEPEPQAAISWTFNPITVGAGLQAGGATILSWSSVNATRCSASGGGNREGEWTGEKPLSGQLLITAAKAGVYTYSLTCTNEDGVSARGDSVLTVRENAKESYGNGGGAWPAWPLLLMLAWRLRRRR